MRKNIYPWENEKVSARTLSIIAISISGATVLVQWFLLLRELRLF